MKSVEEFNLGQIILSEIGKNKLKKGGEFKHLFTNNKELMTKKPKKRRTISPGLENEAVTPRPIRETQFGIGSNIVLRSMEELKIRPENRKSWL